MTKKVMKIRPEKNNACTGLEPITSAIPVQCSTTPSCLVVSVVFILNQKKRE